MKEFTIQKNDAGQRLDRWLAKTLPLLPAPLAQKYIRLISTTSSLTAPPRKTPFSLCISPS